MVRLLKKIAHALKVRLAVRFGTAGEARRGKAGKARRGTAWFGTARFGMAGAVR
jgi:hypothetical protein